MTCEQLGSEINAMESHLVFSGLNAAEPSVATGMETG